jgi:hypothetical protein
VECGRLVDGALVQCRIGLATGLDGGVTDVWLDDLVVQRWVLP